MSNGRNDGAELRSLMEKHNLELKRYMQPTPELLQRLQRSRIIDNKDVKEIQDCEYTEDANESIVQHCMNGPGHIMNDLIRALNETGQEDLVDRFLTPSGNDEASDEPALHPTPINEADESSQTTDCTGASQQSTVSCRLKSRLKEFPIKERSSIKGALNDKENQVYTFAGTVTFKSEKQTYTKKGAYRSYATLIICDSTDVAEMRIYAPWNYENVKEGKTYTFNEVIRQDEEFMLGGGASWCRSQRISVPKKLKKKVEQRKQAVLLKDRSLTAALGTRKSSNIRGKIVKVSPVKYVKDGSLAAKVLALLDQSTIKPVKVTVFGDYAKQSYVPGACVEITDVYPDRVRNEEEEERLESLSTKKESTVKILEDQTEYAELSNLQCQVTIKDPDFKETVDAEVVGIMSSNIYSSCANPACKNKKMEENGSCQKCLGTRTGKYCFVTMVVRYQDKEVWGVTVFKSDLLLLFELRDLEEYTGNEDLTDHIVKHIPKRCKVWFKGDIMKVVSTKRSHTMMDEVQE